MKGPCLTGVTGELTAQVVCDAAGAALQTGLGAMLTVMKIGGALAPVFKLVFALICCPLLRHTLPNPKHAACHNHTLFCLLSQNEVVSCSEAERPVPFAQGDSCFYIAWKENQIHSVGYINYCECKECLKGI